MTQPVAGPLGHLFIVRSDLTRLHCDAWLLPTDRSGSVTSAWRKDRRVAAALDSSSHLSSPLPSGWPETIRSFCAVEGEGGPQVWATRIGGRGETPIDFYLLGLEAFLEGAAASVSKSIQPGGRGVPLLGVPLIGTGRGGGSLRKGGVVEAVVRHLIDYTARQPADVVLVLNNDRALAAAQAVRWAAVAENPSTGPWSHLSAEMVGAAEDLIGLARTGRLVVFFGAGASAAAGLPNWPSLLGELAQVAEIEDPDKLAELDYRDQALLVADALGRARLDAELKRLLAGDRFSLLHALIASLPAREYVTTNFDRLFEVACAAAGVDLAVLPYTKPTMDRWLLKLHGSLGEDDIVLTRADYMGYGRTRTALIGLVQALLITRHMLFVGYSLNDEDFHQTVHDVRVAVDRPGTVKKPFGTALMAEPVGLLSQLWKDAVDIVSPASGGDLLSAGRGGRAVEILLDRMAAEAQRSSVAYLLDPTYTRLLTPEERQLGAELRALRSSVAGAVSPAGEAVRSFIDSMGLAGPELR